MSGRIVFHPLIEADVREVVTRYNSCSAGLGERFKQTFYATVDEIVVWPETNAVKFDEIRTRLIRPFPYLVFYAVETGAIWILSVQYAGRRPTYLRSVVRERK